ncbi:hypothetical protein [Sulfobacillus thermosulfidooxidans]|uniref:hypothetical protein n=1 Tax=Sulfobacillus thermosulfidooxidans TaxID=28034 RepID=UPI0006B577F2|nr:hypothetical protein [Sulfobacillus thermosulfidooxidans]
MIYTIGCPLIIPHSIPWTSQRSVALHATDWVVIDPRGRCEWEVVSYHPYRSRLRAIVPTPQQQNLIADFVRQGGRLVTFLTKDVTQSEQVWVFLDEIKSYIGSLPIYAHGDEWVELRIPRYDWLDGVKSGLSSILSTIRLMPESPAWQFDGTHYSASTRSPSWTVIPLDPGWLILRHGPSYTMGASFDVTLSTLWESLLQEGIA